LTLDDGIKLDILRFHI